jgi:hypothetical protein
VRIVQEEAEGEEEGGGEEAQAQAQAQERQEQQQGQQRQQGQGSGGQRKRKGKNHVLSLSDSDPHDFAKAERVFPRTTQGLVLGFQVRAGQTNSTLEVDLWSRAKGAYRPVQLRFGGAGSGTRTTLQHTKRLSNCRRFGGDGSVRANCSGVDTLVLRGYEVRDTRAALSLPHTNGAARLRGERHSSCTITTTH